MKKPSVLDIIEKIGYRENEYEALRRVVPALINVDRRAFNINDLISVDRVAEMANRGKMSVKCYKHIRSELEKREINEKVGSYTKIYNEVHTKYKMIKPEELFVIALNDKDLKAFLVDKYYNLYKDIEFIDFNVDMFDSYINIIKYCEVVDELNNTNLKAEVENLIHELKQKNYNKVEILKTVRDYINNFRGAD